MTLMRRVVTSIIKGLIGLLCDVHAGALSRVPGQGPLILVTNHVNFLEVPLIFTYLQPRPVVGLVKEENWHHPFTRWLAELWEAVPIRRGESDVAAIRKSLEALEAGNILAVAPEGTRSGHGRLQRGHPGVIMLALKSQAPVLPFAIYGHEHLWRDWAALRRPNVYISIGDAFCLDTGGVKVTRDVRHRITDEIMYQMAALLPPAYRGVYSDLSAATETYLRFPPGATSNLLRAQT